MEPAPIPKNERQRLASLHNLGLLDTSPEERFDLITRTATKIFQVAISTLTLVDAKREWFKSCQGLPQREGDRAISFCGHALLTTEILIIPDTTKDERFFDNPMVVGKPYIRFYAGVPIVNFDGERVGVFCIKDTKPRTFSKDDEEVLKGLAAWAEVEVNSRNLSLALQQGREERLHRTRQEQELKNARAAAQNVLEDLLAERKRLNEVNAKDDAMFASIGDGLVMVDKDIKVVLINRAAEAATGWSNQDALGKIWADIIELATVDGKPVPPGEQPLYLAIHEKRTITTDTTEATPTYIYTRKNKTRFPVALTVSPVMVGNELTGAILVFRDISREQQIDKAKTEFVALASHQLRTPLTSISWYTEMILHGDVGKVTPSQKEYLEKIYQGDQQMIGLVNTLLNVSRLELGTFADTPEPTDVVKLVRGVIGELKLQIDQKKLTLSEGYSPGLPLLNVDPKLLSMVLNNLLLNAVHYTPAQGSVSLDLRLVKRGEFVAKHKLAEDSLAIVVSDTGWGIPKYQQDKIFTKLFRADNVREKDTGGTGLGLYIVKYIINHYAGTIWFASPAPGRVKEGENPGTTFYVTLPLGVGTQEQVPRPLG